MHVNRSSNSWRQKCDQDRSPEDFKNNRNSEHVECESKSGTGNKQGNWNHFKIIQTIPEQLTGKTQN